MSAIAQQRYTAETLWKLGRVSDMQLSPSGKTILYGVTWYDVAANKGNRDLYTLDENAESPRKVTDAKGSELNGIWRPDGKKIGYLSAENGSMQMWEMGINGEDKKQVTNVEGGISGFSYSPDMTHILYTRDVKIEQDAEDLYPDLPLANALIYDDLMYRHWDNWHDYKYSHIFVASYSDGVVNEGRDIMKGEPYDSPLMPNGGMEQITWTPDGKSIAYVCKKLKGKDYALSTNSDIYLYNLETGKTDNLTDQNEGYDHDPVFSPDGSMMVYRSMKTPGFEADKDRIMLMRLKGRAITDLSENFDQSSNNFAFSKDGKSIYFISGIEATYQVYKLDIATGKITQLTKGDHDIQSFALAGNDLIITKMRTGPSF